MKLTIAQFTFGLQLAGQERVVVDLAKAFKKRGCRSLVCTTLFGGDLEGELESGDIPFHCLHLKKSYLPHLLPQVVKYLRTNKVNTVITHGSSGCLLPRIAAVMDGIPAFVHVEHNVSGHKTFYQLMADRLMAKYTDRIVCISENAKESFQAVVKSEPHKLAVIPNGLDTGRFTSRSVTHSRGRNLKRIGIIGRFSEQKGHIYFIEAARQLVRRYKNVEFIFIGDGTLRPVIEQKVNEYGLHSRCQFLGVRADACELLQTFDIFVLSSLWEGLPITLLEAQYFGIPSVVTAVGGNSEVVRHEYNGLIVPPADPPALAAALLRFLTDDKLRTAVQARGKEVFEEKFSIGRMADGYLELIRDIINGKAALNS